MDRQPPSTTSDAIDLYLRTMYSLLRTSGEVRVRAFEEAHAYSGSSLHEGALSPRPDVAAFAYSAARLPACIVDVRLVVVGQSHEHFEADGYDLRDWPTVRSRGRRRAMRWRDLPDGRGVLACFATSTSDIDDLVPILTAWQIEWNKLHRALSSTDTGKHVAAGLPVDDASLAAALGLEPAGLDTLRAALGEAWAAGVRAIATRECDLRLQVLAGTWSQYQRASQRWWSGIEPHYLRERRPRRRPVYFVSSNTHILPNLLGGWTASHRDAILDWAAAANPEDLGPTVAAARERADDAELSNLACYLGRAYAKANGEVEAKIMAEHAAGVATLPSPGKVDVDAQIIELRRLLPANLDPRLRLPGVDRLARSDAVVINIDYPLGMAAYHHLSRLGQGAGEIRGLYVMGKAATLNARVGDVMISGVVHDEHTHNTTLFGNAFTAADVQPFLRFGSVFDNQKALTVRGPFLQNPEYMGVFYREGFSVLEMEAGPYLAAIYELVNWKRHPNNEIVNLTSCPFDVVLHYASDTPYSRRQSLLSKSLSYFGVDATYACAIAILRAIVRTEVAAVGGDSVATGGGAG